MRLYEPRAPMTVRIGAGIMALGMLIAFILELTERWSAEGGHPGMLRGVVFPVLGLCAGVLWTREIALMRGMAYWSWVALLAAVALILVILLPLEWAGLLGASPPKQRLSLLELLVFACFLASNILLFAKPSIVAFWRQNSTGVKNRDVG